jgi:hypothetical protein
MQLGKLGQAATVVAGGAGAGYVDGHWADKQLAGQGYGTAGAAALALLGALGLGGRMGHLALNVGAGGLAGAAYKFANKKGSSDGAVHGVRGALPPSARVISHNEINRIYETIGIRR